MASIAPIYQLTGIELVSKAMYPAPPRSYEGQEFFFDIKVEVRVLAEKHLVLGYVMVKVRIGKDNPVELATLDLSCIFTVQNFAETIMMNDQKLYVVPDEMQKIIIPISISTARGVVFSEFRGTFLNNAVLPIVFLQPDKTAETKPPKE